MCFILLCKPHMMLPGMFFNAIIMAFYIFQIHCLSLKVPMCCRPLFAILGYGFTIRFNPQFCVSVTRYIVPLLTYSVYVNVKMNISRSGSMRGVVQTCLVKLFKVFLVVHITDSSRIYANHSFMLT